MVIENYLLKNTDFGLIFYRKFRSMVNTSNKRVKIYTSNSSLASVASISSICEVVDFETVLTTPTLRSQFRHFLRSELAEENLDFLLETDYYHAFSLSESPEKSHDPLTKKSRDLDIARQIYETFLMGGAEREVNIGARKKIEILERIENNSDLDETLFQAARDEIFHLIKHDSFQRFKNLMAKL